MQEKKRWRRAPPRAAQRQHFPCSNKVSQMLRAFINPGKLKHSSPSITSNSCFSRSNTVTWVGFLLPLFIYLFTFWTWHIETQGLSAGPQPALGELWACPGSCTRWYGRTHSTPCLFSKPQGPQNWRPSLWHCKKYRWKQISAWKLLGTGMPKHIAL